MTCGNRVTRSSSRAVSTSAAPSTSLAAEARSASARAASGQSHSHSVGGTPGEVAPVIAASYAPSGSPAPSRTARGPRRTGTQEARGLGEQLVGPGQVVLRLVLPPLERGELRGDQAGRTRPPPPGVRAQRDPEPVRAALPVPGPQQPAPLVDGHPGEIGVRSVEALQLSPPFLQAGRPVGPRRRSGGVGLPQRRVDEAPPVARLRRGCDAPRRQCGSAGAVGELRAHGCRGTGIRRRPRVTDGLRPLEGGRHGLLRVGLVRPERRLRDLRQGDTVLPRVGPRRRQRSGAPHRLHPQEAAPGREAQVLQPHEELGDEQRVVRLVDLREQGLDGTVLRLVVTEPCRGLPQPCQKSFRDSPTSSTRAWRSTSRRRSTRWARSSPSRSARSAARRSSGTPRGGASARAWCSAIAEVAARPPVVSASLPERSSSHRLGEGGVHPASFLPGQEGVERLGLEGVVEPVAAMG